MTATSHNGGRSQCNFWFPTLANDYPFINHIKTSGNPNYINFTSRPQPSEVDANGYPNAIVNGGLRWSFSIPSQTNRPGNWKCRWTGGGAAGSISTSFSGSAAITGSKTGNSGFFTCRPTVQTISLGINGFTGGNPITNLEFYYEEDEALLDAGSLFTPYFLQRLRQANFGVLRFLDWQFANDTNVVLWAHRKPLTYVHWAGNEFRSDIYTGITTNSGDDFSASAPSSWGGLVDKAIVSVMFSATPAGTAPTLDVGGTGAKTIKSSFGNALTATTKPRVGLMGTLVYDADLDCWLKFGAENDGQFNDVLLQNGVPPEIIVQLCEEVGAHMYVIQPPLGADPISNYCSSWATYCKLRSSSSWMIPRFEGPNENWNSLFFANGYGRNKALALWGSSLDDANWAGKVYSTLGQSISSVFGGDRTKYQVIAGMQQSSGANSAASNTKLNSDRYVSINGGSAAKNWVTHIAPAAYLAFPPNYYSFTEVAADSYANSIGTASEKDEIGSKYAATIILDVPGVTTTVPYFRSRMSDWVAWAAGFGLKTTLYEGGESQDSITADFTSNITSITRVAQAVVALPTTNLTNPIPPVGSQVTFSNTVGGMTEIRGLTGTVLSNDTNLNTFVVGIDSSGFSSFTSGGFITHVNSKNNFNSLLQSVMTASALVDSEYDYLQAMVDVGVEFPSEYMFCGSSQWASLRPDIYAANGEPKFTAHVLFNAVAEEAVVTSGASYLTPEELAAIRRYWEELDEGRDLSRRKRDEIEARLSRTIEAAYDKAMGIEPEAAKAIAAAVPKAALLPAPDLVKSSKIATLSIDWSRVAKDIDAVDRILQVLGKQIDRLDENAKLSAAARVKLDRLRQDEEDIELLMLAL